MKRLILEVLDRVRPALEFHGGDVQLVKINAKKHTVYVKFTGNCESCVLSEITLHQLLEKELHHAVPDIRSVILV